MEIVGTDRCCGCRACVQVCPKEAVTVITDKYGFEQVQVDDKKCVNCGICKAVCPIINQNKNDGKFSCGSAYCKDESIRKWGSSGGLFGLFSNAGGRKNRLCHRPVRLREPDPLV